MYFHNFLETDYLFFLTLYNKKEKRTLEFRRYVDNV